MFFLFFLFFLFLVFLVFLTSSSSPILPNNRHPSHLLRSLEDLSQEEGVNAPGGMTSTSGSLGGLRRGVGVGRGDSTGRLASPAPHAMAPALNINLVLADDYEECYAYNGNGGNSPGGAQQPLSTSALTTTSLTGLGGGNMRLPTLDTVGRDVLKHVGTNKRRAEEADIIATASVDSISQTSTGMPLSKGAGSVMKSKITKNKKVTPAMRRRLKIAEENAKLGGNEGRKPLVVKASSQSQLDTLRLRNNTVRSALSADPRNGALPPSEMPYYDPATYRQPATLEDKLRNMLDAEPDMDLLSFASLDEYGSDASLALQSLEDSTGGGRHRDKHKWRKDFLVKRIKFADAFDSDSDDGKNDGISAEPDNFDFDMSLDNPDDDEEEEEEEEEEGVPAGMRRVLVSVAVPAVVDAETGMETYSAVEAVYELLPETASATGSTTGSTASHSQVATPTTGRSGTGTSAASQSRPITGDSSRKPSGDPNATDAGAGPDGDYTSLEAPKLGSVAADAFPGSEPLAGSSFVAAGDMGSINSAGGDNDGVGFAGLNVADTTTPLAPASPDVNGDIGDRAGTSPEVGLKQSISLVRASIDGELAAPIVPALPDAQRGNGDYLVAMSQVSGLGQESLPDGAMSHSQSSLHGGSSSVVSQSSAESSVIGFGSEMSVSRHSAQNAVELEEQRKEKKREAYRAKMRANKLAELEEEAAQKQALFIANHVDPNTAKRVDYKFPEHGIQVPGVGEEYIRYRGYADDSIFLGPEGVVMTQKDNAHSTLLDTVLMDVRLRSPAYGDREARPMSPWERESLQSRQHEKMFSMLVRTSPPASPDLSRRKVTHQVVLLSEQMRQTAELEAEEQFSYKPFKDGDSPIPASQRFRMEAEENRVNIEEERLARRQAKLEQKAEKDRLALAAAGIKQPRRKRLQKEKPKASAEEVPIAYAVSGGGRGGGGVSCSVVSTHPPSIAYKPKKQYTKEFKPTEELVELALVPKKAKKEGFRKPQIKISRGVAVHTRDNTELDKHCLLSSSEHEVWNGTATDNKQQSQLLALLSSHTKLQKAAESGNSGSAGLLSISSRAGVRKGGISMQGSAEIYADPLLPLSVSAEGSRISTGTGNNVKSGSAASAGAGADAGAVVAEGSTISLSSEK